jgi:osmotically-inducible protein OsmY
MAKRKLIFWGGAGALAMYFLDPDKGRTRRALVQDKITKFRTRGSRTVEQASRSVSEQAYGVERKVASARQEETPPANDQTLAAKIESEVLGKAEYPKGSINVNVENGVVYLRGEVPSQDTKSAIEQDVRKVTGVVGVENLLHLPGEPAPTKE